MLSDDRLALAVEGDHERYAGAGIVAGFLLPVGARLGLARGDGTDGRRDAVVDVVLLGLDALSLQNLLNGF